MKFYHATNYNNLGSILKSGINKGCDGIIYLTTQPEDAIKFLLIRGIKCILVVEVDIDEELVKEQFDHSEKIFNCRVYGYYDKIEYESITSYIKYEFTSNMNYEL